MKIAEYSLITFGIVFILGVLIFSIFYQINHDKKWEQFKISHNCKIIGHMDGSAFNTFGISPNGQMVIGVGSTPDKVEYHCDDGINYWIDQ